MTRITDLSRLFAAERGAEPPAGAAEAGLNRLLGSLAAHAAPLPVAVGSLHLGWSVVGKWLGVGFVVGLSGAGAAAYVSSSNESSRLAVAPAVVSAAAPVAAVPTQAQVEPRALPVASTATPAAAKESSRGEVVALGAPLPSASTSGSTFDEELRLIAAAKRQLDAGQVPAARALLDEHRQRFGAGVFALERDGLSALASCSGKPDPEIARAFATAHPSSPLLTQIQRRCGGESSTPGAGPATDSMERPK